jgi:hypoxanthine phosphoribosyltransferase
MKPSIFVGSSTEGLSIARAIQLQLDRVAEVTVWADNVFRLSEFAYDAVDRQLSQSQFGIFVLTADDLVNSRGKQTRAPRDNVLFELGMFAGRLGLRKTLLVHERGVPLKIPTDLLGITCATYEPHVSGNVAAALGPTCTLIRSAIEASPQTVRIRWEQVSAWVKDLASLLKRSPARGGFTFDVMLGINGGGLVVADLLSRCYAGQQPVLSFWADRRTRRPTFDGAGNWANEHLWPMLSGDRVTNVLVVDDITRTGTTVVEAKRVLESRFPDKRIKNAVLIADTKVVPSEVDYCVTRLQTENLELPFSELET